MLGYITIGQPITRNIHLGIKNADQTGANQHNKLEILILLLLLVIIKIDRKLKRNSGNLHFFDINHFADFDFLGLPAKF